MKGVDLADTLKLFADSYPAAYQTLYEAKPITCSVTGTTFDALPAPCAVILDVSMPITVNSKYKELITAIVLSYIYFQFFAFSQFQVTRAVSGRSAPIIVCVAAGAGAIIRLFGPEHLGGRGDFGAKIDAEVERTGLSDDEIGRKVCISYHPSRRNK